MTVIRHKTFLSYHKDDQDLVEDFISEFDDEQDAFIMRGIRAPEDLVDSDDTDYVMGEIRRRFLKDSTVTLALLGRCTWARRFVDWEIQSSLRRPANGLPNGLLGVILDPDTTRATLPDRLKQNYASGYAGFYVYPSNPSTLARWIDQAYQARTESANLIKNPRARFSYNRSCP